MTAYRRSPLLLSAALAACALLAPRQDAGAQSSRSRRESQQNDARSRIDTTVAFGKGGQVDLSLGSGDIIVSTWNRAEARIVARVEHGAIDLNVASNRIELGLVRRGGGDARYELTVPVGTRVQAQTSSGDIRIKGTGAVVEARASSGSIEVEDAAERIDLAASSGDIRASKLRGRTKINVTSGDIELDDLVGDLEIHSVSSEIRIDRAKSSKVEVNLTSGQITYEGTIDPKGEYEFSTHSGDVRLDIPATSSANLELQTWNGEITSQFPMTLQPGERTGNSDRGKHGKKYQFTVGNGGARVTVGTFSGDITIGRTTRSTKED